MTADQDSPQVRDGDPDLDRLHARYRRDYDPFAPVTMGEQIAEIADRREKCPVSYSETNRAWILTTYEDISAVLRRNNRGVISFPISPDGSNRPGSNNAMIPIELDGPEHRQYRTLLDPSFSPKRVAALETTLRAAANDLIDEFVETGRCDFVQQFALPFPGATVMAIMGWPLEDLGRMNEWTGVIMHGLVGASEEESDAARQRAQGELYQYMMDLIQSRRNSPGDDVSTILIEAEIDGKPLDDATLFDVFLLMMLAGLDTVKSVLAQSAIYLAAHPDRWDAMFASPEVLDAAIEELLRVGSPAVPSRTITDEFLDVGGVRLPKGERMHFALAAANRDPEYYPDPDEVKFDRPVKPHLSFGLGPHRCLGVHLARLELRIAFEELHRRIPTFSLDPAASPVEHLGMAWGVDNVHLLFPPGSRETQA